MDNELALGSSEAWRKGSVSNPFCQLVIRAIRGDSHPLGGNRKLLAEHLRLHRIRHAIPRKTLAAQLGVSRETLKNWEQGRTSSKPEILACDRPLDQGHMVGFRTRGQGRWLTWTSDNLQTALRNSTVHGKNCRIDWPVVRKPPGGTPDLDHHSTMVRSQCAQVGTVFEGKPRAGEDIWASAIFRIVS
jgi:DNA-binding XRE family transcriptional regulator